MPPSNSNCWQKGSDAKLNLIDSVALSSRYEAMRELVLRVRSETDLTQLVMTICKSWRFAANIADWRLLCRMDQEFILIDCVNTDITITNNYQLTEIESKLWDSRVPRFLKCPQVAQEYPGLELLLRQERCNDLVMMSLDTMGRGLQFYLIASSCAGGFGQLDFKFIKDIGLLLASEMSDRLIAQKLVRTLEQTARQDPLTSLANRRYFKETLDAYWRNAIRQKDPLSLLMIDVDRFKVFNDTFGHVAGDDCLRKVAGAIQNISKRPLDFSARLGGEEFGMLLPDTSEDGAMAIAQRVIEAIDDLAIPHLIGGVPSLVSVSIGTATCIPEHLEDPTRLIELADEALYRAKASGRHQACAAKTTI